MANIEIREFSLERMVRAVEKVRDRLLRATSALERARVPYAVVGGNAVAAWVIRVAESAVRNTQDVDLLIRRDDLDSAAAALAEIGFIRRHSAGMEMFLDGPGAKARDAVHVIFAGEKVRPGDLYPAADVDQATRMESFQVVSLESLVRMKLTSFRDKDRTHLRDLMDVGLIDSTWTNRLPADLAARLQGLIDTPGG